MPSLGSSWVFRCLFCAMVTRGSKRSYFDMLDAFKVTTCKHLLLKWRKLHLRSVLKKSNSNSSSTYTPTPTLFLNILCRLLFFSLQKKIFWDRRINENFENVDICWTLRRQRSSPCAARIPRSASRVRRTAARGGSILNHWCPAVPPTISATMFQFFSICL